MLRRTPHLYRQLILKSGHVVPSGRLYLLSEYRKFAAELRSAPAATPDAEAFVEAALAGVDARIGELEALDSCEAVEKKFGLTVENLIEQAGIDAIIARLTLRHNVGVGDEAFQIDSIASLARDMQALHDEREGEDGEPRNPKS